ncbi:hypothetical protein Ahy_B01g056664 [Arachis hypogaea]|uniref:Protein FAR1-RELATED SEQUENCE n=1 Tax=Arachis hypogaea TaxID=3818 RepID=A0A445AZA0_ARAHY|nr:hypothetical protein Ahy_B01g056664 [Arachis hypogaea]
MTLVVLHHSHPCCPNQVEMLKQHRELSMSVCRTIENNEPSKTYQSFVAVVGGHRESNFIEKDVRSYITREVRNYGLGDNKWLSEVYIASFWVYPSSDLVYLDHHFWTGMRSTQRSESMHAFFNKFITQNSSLIQFVKQYDNCLGSREQRKRESDAADFHTIIPCETKSSIEAQFQHVYTHDKFKEFQAQFRGKVNCIIRSKHSALGYTIYEVVEQIFNSIFNKFGVTYDAVAAEVKCECFLFESRGILCRHALSVLSFERSKNIKRRHTHIKSSHDEPLLEPRSKRFDKLVFHSQNICEFASEPEEFTTILHRTYDNAMVEMQEHKAKSNEKYSLSHEDANLKLLTSFKALHV